MGGSGGGGWGGRFKWWFRCASSTEYLYEYTAAYRHDRMSK